MESNRFKKKGKTPRPTMEVGTWKTKRVKRTEKQWEEVENYVVPLDTEWARQTLIEALAKKLDIVIPKDARIDWDYEPKIHWKGQPVPCKEPDDEEEDDEV